MARGLKAIARGLSLNKFCKSDFPRRRVGAAEAFNAMWFSELQETSKKHSKFAFFHFPGPEFRSAVEVLEGFCNIFTSLCRIIWRLISFESGGLKIFAETFDFESSRDDEQLVDSSTSHVRVL